jgi:hypothetical protein
MENMTSDFLHSTELDTRPEEARILSAQISLLFFIFFVLIYVCSSYLQRSTFENLLSFYGPDGPGLYPNVVLPKPYGVHFFGDFLLPQWQSRLSNPWIYNDPAGPPINNYLPFTMAIFRFLAQFSYWKSFIGFFASSLVLLTAPLITGLKSFAKLEKLQLIVASVLLTGPMISLLDRGNLQLLLIALCLTALALHQNNFANTAAVVLGLAIALKGYPAVLLIFFVRERQFRALFLSISTAIVSTLAAISLYSVGIWQGLTLVKRNIELWGVSYTRGYLSYNNSIKGTLVSVESFNIPLVSRLSTFLLAHVGLVSLVILAVALFVLLNNRTTNFEVALVCAALMCGLVDYVAPYAIGLYFIAVYYLWSEGSQVPRRWFIAYGWLVAILLAPKGIPISFWRSAFAFSSPTYTSLLGGICSTTLVILVAMRTTQRESVRQVLKLEILRNVNS